MTNDRVRWEAVGILTISQQNALRVIWGKLLGGRWCATFNHDEVRQTPMCAEAYLRNELCDVVLGRWDKLLGIEVNSSDWELGRGEEESKASPRARVDAALNKGGESLATGQLRSRSSC